MRIIPHYELPALLRMAGLLPTTREYADPAHIQRLTVRESHSPDFVSGPHRKILPAHEETERKFPLGDRPALSGLLPILFAAVEAHSVLVTIEEGAFWLNNKAQLSYLSDVKDAQRIGHFLRRRGLTDRFRGGFVVSQSAFESALPILAASAFSGGGDVLFSSLEPASCRLTVLACHQFDLHLATPHKALLPRLADLAARKGLQADSLFLPEF